MIKGCTHQVLAVGVDGELVAVLGGAGLWWEISERAQLPDLADGKW